ncbi:MAG: sigma-54-dependent Fis family transcriptional regulator [Acidobacteria bacterium]|nr:sigma-54-dependent Fis family transcriptional regulator [Acidobacteriota bacterium]
MPSKPTEPSQPREPKIPKAASPVQAHRPVLVVEDDLALAQMVTTLLEAEGYAVSEARSSTEALERLAENNYSIVVSDIYLDERSGLDILRRARSLNSSCAVILMTGRGSLETVLEATREGAFDYLAKPFAVEQLLQAVKNAESALQVSSPVPTNKGQAQPPVLVGNSPAMVEVYKFISRVGQADTTVLLQGETGTGKELVARLIHESGPRREARFVVVDCGAISPSLLEAELFGAVRGAYTGADRDRTGLLEAADGGTVLFDEIGEIDPAFQLRLLRFLQEREVRPVGSAVARKVDVRIVAASNRDLRKLVAEKKFREDLWYRLHVTSLQLVPLRERSQDLEPLVDHFLEVFRQRLGRPLQLSAGARKAAAAYPWPGNVRQLQNVLERLAILHRGPVVEEAEFRQALASLDPSQEKRGGSETLAGLEEEHIRSVLAATHGNKARAAELLGIERKTLYRKLEKIRPVSS